MKTNRTLILSLFILILITPCISFAQLRVNVGGNVGIGQTIPTQKLDIFGSAIMEGSVNKFYYNSINHYIGMVTTSDFGIVNKESNWLRIGSNLGIAFWGQGNAEGASYTYNMFLNNYGLGIGTNAQAYTSAALYVAGNATFTGTVSSASDERFKKNIANINSPLEKILSLNGKEYEFRINEFPEKNFSDGKNFGFLAQQIKEVLPELVSADNKGYLSVNYIGIIPFLVEAFKEEHILVATQKEEIELLASKIETLTYDINTCCQSLKERSSKEGDNSSIKLNLGSILYQNIPNPFTESTSIQYSVNSKCTNAQLYITDLQGRLIRTFSDLQKGKGMVNINAKELSAGVYNYILVVDGVEVDTKHMILTQK